MRQRILLVLAAALLCVQAPLLAKDQEAAPKGQTAAADLAKQQKEDLVVNLNVMRNQDLKVAVLQQLFNEEVEKLKNSQAAFCSEYKLNLDKFRKGLYRYDEKQGKFIEVK